MTSEQFAREIVALTDTLYRVSYSILRDACDREDAVQSCLEKAWRRRRSLREERYLKTWLVRILINECYDIHRRRAREAPRDIPERAAPPGADRELHDALMRLPEEVRTPIVLHCMEGYPVGEIASALRLAQGTVKSRMRRGRAMLKELLSEMAIVGIGNAAAAEGVGGVVSSLDWRLEADGTLVFMLSGEAPQGAGDVLEVALSCNVTPLVPAPEGEGITMQYYEPGAEEPTSRFIGYDADAENIQRSELTFALSAAGASESPACELSAEYPGCGVRVDGVEFSLSPMAAYYEIHYTVVDEAAYAATEDGVWFEFLDGSGERLPSGATRSGEVAQQADGSFVQRGSLSARGDLSEIAALRAYNCWTKERYERSELTFAASEERP